MFLLKADIGPRTSEDPEVGPIAVEWSEPRPANQARRHADVKVQSIESEPLSYDKCFSCWCQTLFTMLRGKFQKHTVHKDWKSPNGLSVETVGWAVGGGGDHSKNYKSEGCPFDNSYYSLFDHHPNLVFLKL